MKIRRDRMRITRSSVLPNLITVGNGICGFAALVKILKVGVTSDQSPVLGGENYLVMAAWLVLLGMVFDVFDGRVARMTGKTSDLGAQLDSLCDLLTFGVVPALLVVRINMIEEAVSPNWVWFLALLYFVGALLRLARFNVENDHDDDAHLCFKGLPSPAAAGCVATLVILYYYIRDFRGVRLEYLSERIQYLSEYKETLQASVAWIPYVLPLLAAFLGYTMVHTRLKFDHVASRLFGRHRSFDFMSKLVFGGVLVAALPEILLPLFFIGYLISTPARALFRLATGKRDDPSPAIGGNGADSGGPPSRLPDQHEVER